MLVVENNQRFIQWGVEGTVSPLAYTGDTVITIDPGKTNMAMVVGTPDGTVLDTVEFSGNNRGSATPMDTSRYCYEVQAYLKRYLTHARLYTVAMEQTILKHGVNYYHSNQVLNEIRSTIISFFLSEYGVRVEEINNWSWKHAILPEGYRSQKEKGSKRWFRDCFPDSPYNNYYHADMTDCLCIYMYVCQYLCKNYSMICNKKEEPIVKYDFSIFPSTFSTGDKITVVTYNDLYGVYNNLAFYANRILHGFCMEVPAKDLEMRDIYTRSMLFTSNNIWDNRVKLVGGRK